MLSCTIASVPSRERARARAREDEDDGEGVGEGEDDGEGDGDGDGEGDGYNEGECRLLPILVLEGIIELSLKGGPRAEKLPRVGVGVRT